MFWCLLSNCLQVVPPGPILPNASENFGRLTSKVDDIAPGPLNVMTTTKLNFYNVLDLEAVATHEFTVFNGVPFYYLITLQANLLVDSADAVSRGLDQTFGYFDVDDTADYLRTLTITGIDGHALDGALSRG